MKDIFSDNGPLQAILGNYEYRDEQYRMAQFILEKLYDRGHALIEAGTGTGKTLAYLVPAVAYAVESGKKITLTTETKTLQKQLLTKDLPLVKKLISEHLGRDFTYSLCLGSSNYPCKKRFELALSKGHFTHEQLKKIEPLSDLFKSGKIFTRLDVTVSQTVWAEICREGESCSSFRCPFISQCCYQKARKAWTQSTVLVMNHYLFFTNIAAGRTYLPETEIVIFDEAHSLEEIASSQLGSTAGYDQLMEITGLFHRPRKKNTLLNHLANKKAKETALTELKEINAEASSFFESMRGLINRKKTLRLREPVSAGATLAVKLKNFLFLMNELEEAFSGDEFLRTEFDIARGKLFLYLEALNTVVYQTREQYVYWMEESAAALAGTVTLRAQPVDIAEIMRNEVLACYESCLFVSATLAVNGDFSYIAGRLGMSAHASLALGSAFDYKTQMVVYIGRDLPPPESREFSPRSAGASAEIVSLLGGNCLFLFTSYKMLGEIKGLLQNMIAMPIYSQDEMPSSQAMERYVRDGSSILMGTHSFWQGIDLPGDILRGVIMMKLPFSVPDTPPMEARIEKIVESGRNAFVSLQIPEAVIKFKQGIGRLIRSKKDWGVVAIMDSRIQTKPYGRTFLRALPPGCIITHDLAELKKIIEEKRTP